MKVNTIVAILLIAIASLYFQEAQKQIELKKTPKASSITTQKKTSDTIPIQLNRPDALSYKTKQEVLDLRKKYVQNSIFKNPDYQPNEHVFGDIEDNKPWISMKECRYEDTGLSDIDGPSEEGRYISNPELLVAPEYAFYGYSCEKLKTKNVKEEFPSYITYNKKKNEITVTYDGLPYCTRKTRHYELKGLNARDFGYNWAYIDKSKSSFEFEFINEPNITNTVVEFEDLLHTGSSCGHEGGCNNASPKQEELQFNYPCTKKDNFKIVPRQTLYIKLWKNKPSSPEDTPDIVEKLVFKNLYMKKY